MNACFGQFGHGRWLLALDGGFEFLRGDVGYSEGGLGLALRESGIGGSLLSARVVTVPCTLLNLGLILGRFNLRSSSP
jgi:hypothetical protein